jgi:transcriptional regulator with GAF, ATPase, and Fis domain
MKSTATWKRDELQLMNTDLPEGDNELAAPPSNITTLKELTLRLLREVQAFGDTHAPTIDDGIDFYDEVKRFEIDLIKRALLQTGGHQGRAAQLLNLKITTLNSKIKHYNITVTGLAKGFSLVDSNQVGTRQLA